MPLAPSARKREILAAVIEYITENGVANLSLRPLAAATGTKARLLIYHFGSKENLLAEAMAALRDHVQETFADAADSRKAATAGELARRFWRRATLKRNVGILRVFFEALALALTNGGKYGNYMKGSAASWHRLFAASLPTHLTPAHRKMYATLVVDTLNGLLLDYLVTGNLRRTTRALDIFAIEFDRLTLGRKK
jgi:AcrR family transcriptional regulator